MQNFDIPLHDIKPIVDVQEFSLYYFLSISFVILLLIFALSYLLYKWLKKRNEYNLRKEHLSVLKSLKNEDTKKFAYAITLYGATFKDDSPRQTEMFINLTSRLEEYKYKKEVESLDNETLSYFELYKEMCDA